MIIIALMALIFTAVPVHAEEGGRPALVVLSKVKKEMASDTTRITGNLYFEKTGLISAEIAGKAESVFFKEGDEVKKGDKLVKTDTELLEKELSLQFSKLAQIDIRIAKAKKDLKRYEELYKNDAASESSYDDLKYGFDGLMEEKAALKKQIDMTNIKLEKSTVYSPFTGIILVKNVEKGNWVQPGASIAKIGASDSVSVKVPVSERFIKFSKEGDHLNVNLTAVDKNLKGEVIGFMPYADPKTRNLYLKLALDYKGPVAENMSAVVDVPSSPKREVFLVPRDALVSFQGAKMVYTLNGNKAKSVGVDVLGYNGKNAQISSKDITEGMKIVVEGNERLRPDQAVTVVGEK
jgi:RND family efflux transporter MFP subunit